MPERTRAPWGPLNPKYPPSRGAFPPLQVQRKYTEGLVARDRGHAVLRHAEPTCGPQVDSPDLMKEKKEEKERNPNPCQDGLLQQLLHGFT